MVLVTMKLLKSITLVQLPPLSIYSTFLILTGMKTLNSNNLKFLETKTLGNCSSTALTQTLNLCTHLKIK